MYFFSMHTDSGISAIEKIIQLMAEGDEIRVAAVGVLETHCHFLLYKPVLFRFR